jgi:hypothetical protein
MKFKQYLSIISDNHFIPTPRFQWVIRKNPRKTSREEAIAASVIEQANPRENITSHFPWGPEEQLVLQQLWIGDDTAEWRDVPIRDAKKLFSVEETEDGEIPIPNAVKEPGMIQGDFQQRLNELLGGE